MLGEELENVWNYPLQLINCFTKHLTNSHKSLLALEYKTNGSASLILTNTVTGKITSPILTLAQM